MKRRRWDAHVGVDVCAGKGKVPELALAFGRKTAEASGQELNLQSKVNEMVVQVAPKVGSPSWPHLKTSGVAD